MENVRKIGIGITMIIPSFVGAGAFWGIFNSWLAVFIWLVTMALLYGRIITGKSVPFRSWFIILIWVLIMIVLFYKVLEKKLVLIFG